MKIVLEVGQACISFSVNGKNFFPRLEWLTNNQGQIHIFIKCKHFRLQNNCIFIMFAYSVIAYFQLLSYILFLFSTHLSFNSSTPLSSEIVNMRDHIQEYYYHVHYAPAHITLCPTGTK